MVFCGSVRDADAVAAAPNVGGGYAAVEACADGCPVNAGGKRDDENGSLKTSDCRSASSPGAVTRRCNVGSRAVSGDVGERMGPAVVADAAPTELPVAVVTGFGRSGCPGRLTFPRVSSGSSAGTELDIEQGSGRSRGVNRRAFADRGRFNRCRSGPGNRRRPNSDAAKE